MTVPRASIIYWFPESALKNDGGATRVRAWSRFLSSAGYDVTIDAVWNLTGQGSTAKAARLSRLKRALIPMPLLRSIPENAVGADLVINTVPCTFKDTLGKIEKSRLVLDWMDLWSVNSRTVGNERLLSRPGGLVQSYIWRRREQRWLPRSGVNVFAGYADFELATTLAPQAVSSWMTIPTTSQSDSSNSVVDPKSVGFIGNMAYAPNELALRRFLKTQFREFHEAGFNLTVAGYDSERVANWGYPINVIGSIEDLADFYQQVAAILVPIDAGGGIKVKAIEAMGFGKPVIGTRHVRDGMPPGVRDYILTLDDLFTGRPLRSVSRTLFNEWFSASAFEIQARSVLAALDNGRHDNV